MSVIDPADDLPGQQLAHMQTVALLTRQAMDELSGLYGYLEFKVDTTLAGLRMVRCGPLTGGADDMLREATDAYLARMMAVCEAAAQRIVNTVEALPMAPWIKGRLAEFANQADRELGQIFDSHLGRTSETVRPDGRPNEEVQRIGDEAKRQIDRLSDDYLRQIFDQTRS